MVWEEIGHLAFPSEWTASGHAPLANGTYREPAAPGAASEIVVRLRHPVALGELAGRPSAAAVLVTEPGGSGSFTNLALLQRINGDWKVVDQVLLGDRIRLSAMAFDDRGIRVDMITHGPGKPMCCPTRKARSQFVLEDGRLRKTLPLEAMPLTGRIWKWHGTVQDSAGQTTPTDPERYTIEFLEDGQVRVSVDCNSAGGTFTVFRNRITIDMAYATMAACPPTSLENIFTQDLLATERFFFKENRLHLMLTGRSGKMIFFR